jgi:eukaryotic-like serine/threonine-protein kinase
VDPARWNEISQLAAAAAETGGPEREALLASRPDLRSEVESLLCYLEDGSGPLDSPPPLAGEVIESGRRIGAYRILRELGRGGMGVVYLARRSGAGFEQTVALKLAQAAFQSEFFLRRFLDERQILARLEHPNIARLLDGGVTADGAPYLVLQYVEGESLDTWCNSRGASLHELIAIFLKICAAVEYAHEHLVVHRDLKPANILVTAAGEPMLLDFGTARLLEDTAPSGATRTAAPMITLRYASPEQVRGLAGATRSDVYSLGVILYELLTGCWPYPVEGEGPPAQLRAIAEADPIPPSRSQTSAARSRELRGDLDSILLKALDKDPAHRYGTAAQFADDLRRALDRQPVLARPLTWRYRAGRFLLRHRWAATTAAAILLTLTGATAYSIRQARIADRERIKAEQVAMFMERLMGASRSGQVSPLARRGRDLTVVELVDEAARTVGNEFKDRPEVEAGLRSTIASTYLAMGMRAEAAPHVEQAVRLAESVYGPNHPATARAWNARGRLRLAAGEFEGAVEDLRAATRVLESVNSPDLPFARSFSAKPSTAAPISPAHASSSKLPWPVCADSSARITWRPRR